jgi:hypothetical protein
VVAGYDAVRRRVRGSGPSEEHGTALAGVLAASLPSRERVLALRVAGRPRGGGGEQGTTDDLLLGLERAVDPDGDGDTEDAVKVALVGVSAPYAGFASAPEAAAAASARRLGTLVVAPAGNDGPGAGAFGTLGSPGAAPGVLTAGAWAAGESSDGGLPRVRLALAGRDGRALLEGSLLGGGTGEALDLRTSGLLGPSQADPRARGRALGAAPLEYFDVEARPRARGRMVVVPATGRGAAPVLAVRAAAAAPAGARALVVCDPSGRARLLPLPRGAAGGMPVVGLSGRAARKALELTRRDGARARLSRPEARQLEDGGSTSSHGPTYELEPEPDVSLGGVAETARPGGGRALVAGTSVAAAHAAAAAAGLHRRVPGASPAELASRLVSSARPGGPLLERGAGPPDLARAAAARAWADPPLVALRRVGPRLARARVTLHGPGAAAAARGARLRVEGLASRAPRARRRGGAVVLEAEFSARGARLPALATGHLRLGGPEPRPTVPLLLPPEPPPARLGPLRLTRQDGRRGVSFAAGLASRGSGGARVEPVGRLVLTLVGEAGERVRELTPPGGARDLLPGEYAYALSREEMAALPSGRYRFEARARGTAGGREATGRSPAFSVP